MKKTLKGACAMKSRTLNMTEGNPTRLLLIFALPMLIGNLFQQLYNAVTELGITQPVVPMWLPDGFALTSLKTFNSDKEERIKHFQ